MVKRVATHRTTAPVVEAQVPWWSDEPGSIARMLDLCAASAPGRHARLHEALITLDRALPQLLEDGELSANRLETGGPEADAVLCIADVLTQCGHEARARQLLVEAVEMGVISQQAAEATGIAGSQGELRERDLYSVVGEPESPEVAAYRKKAQYFSGEIDALAERMDDAGRLKALASGVEQIWRSHSGIQFDDGQAHPGRVMSHDTMIHDESMRGSAPRSERARSSLREALHKLDATHPHLLPDTEDEMPLVFAKTSFVDGASLVAVMRARIRLRGQRSALGLFRRAVLANCIEWQRAPVAKAIIGLLSSVPHSQEEAAPAVRALRAAMEISVDRADRQALRACLKALDAVEDDTPRAQHLHRIKDSYCRILDILGAQQMPVLQQLHLSVSSAILPLEEERGGYASEEGLRCTKRYELQARRFGGQLASEGPSYRAHIEYFLGKYLLHASLAGDEELPRFCQGMAALQGQAWHGFENLF